VKSSGEEAVLLISGRLESGTKVQQNPFHCLMTLGRLLIVREQMLGSMWFQ
jgi:hypothetical protein